MLTGLAATCPPMLDFNALYSTGIAQTISCPGGKAVLGNPWANLDVNNPNATQQSLIGCPTYFCESGSQVNCNTEAMMILGAGALALFLLPGFTKIFALAAIPISFSVGLCGSGL
jgi:hypothetical protein